jgi:hypothetical protein
MKINAGIAYTLLQPAGPCKPDINKVIEMTKAWLVQPHEGGGDTGSHRKEDDQSKERDA